MRLTIHNLREYSFVTGIILLLLVLMSGFSSATFASEGGKSGMDDVGGTLLHHIMDSREWKIVPGLPSLKISNIHIGNVTIPITQFVVMLLINMAVLLFVMIKAFNRQSIIPSKLGSMIEPIIFFVRDSLVYPAMGEEMGKKWIDFFYTLFFFILGANFLGMIPLFKTTTGNLSVTSALAIVIFISILVTGFKKLGPIGFFTAMVPKGVPLPIAVLLLVIEVVNLFIRSGVLSIRLFANMIAGHMVISSLLLLMFIIHPLVVAVSVPMSLFIYLLEVLVAIIQAVVFTMLSAVFIKMASSHH